MDVVVTKTPDGWAARHGEVAVGTAAASVGSARVTVQVEAGHCGERSVRTPIPAGSMVTVNEDSEWLRQNPDQEQEWLRQLSLIYGGLIGIGVIMVQPFLTAASLDLSAMVCVVAFSVAIPLLAALTLVNRQEAFRRRASRSVLAEIARVVAQNLALVGVVAGFWHIHWIAGVGMLASGLVGVAVYSAGYTRLERDQGPRHQEGEEPGDTET